MSLGEVARQLTYRIDPSAWTGTQGIHIDGEEAEAMVGLTIDGREYDEEWTFVREGASWKVNILPSLGVCTDPAYQVPTFRKSGAA